MESQKDWVGKGPQEVIWSNVPAQARPAIASCPRHVQLIFEHCWKHPYYCSSGTICLLCHKAILLAHVQPGVQQNPLAVLCKDVFPVCADSWHVPSQMENFAHFLAELSCWETCCLISPACCGLMDGTRPSGKSASLSFASPAHSVRGLCSIIQIMMSESHVKPTTILEI